jgi:hypothetical protein
VPTPDSRPSTKVEWAAPAPARSVDGVTDGEGTVVRRPLVDRVVGAVVIPGALVLAGILLPVLARWLLSLSSGLPMRPVVRLVGAVDTWWEIALHLALWSALGVGIAVSEAAKATTATVDDARLRLARSDGARTFARDEIGAVFVDGRHLVVQDRDSRPVFRETHGLAVPELAAVLRRYGYPWHDADPYLDRYRRWRPGDPDLPPALDPLLNARAGARKRKADAEVRDLTAAADRLGFAVRDEGDAQFWRPLHDG